MISEASTLWFITTNEHRATYGVAPVADGIGHPQLVDQTRREQCHVRTE